MNSEKMTKLRRATVFPPHDLLIAPVPFGRAREMGSLEKASWSSSPRPRPGLCPAELPGNPGGGPPAPGRVFRERVEQAQRAQRARLDAADLPAYRMQDPRRALLLVREANEQTGYKNLHYLDALSLALHRTGETATAVAYQAPGGRARSPVRAAQLPGGAGQVRGGAQGTGGMSRRSNHAVVVDQKRKSIASRSTAKAL